MVTSQVLAGVFVQAQSCTTIDTVNRHLMVAGGLTISKEVLGYFEQ